MEAKTKKAFEELKLRELFEELLTIPEKPGKEAAAKRGKAFEGLVNDVLDAHGLLLRGDYYTQDNRSEQIDGAFEVMNRICLLEVKWKESSVAASDLFAFLGKVEGKFVGTIGLFVSYETLSRNFIDALRGGRRQCVMVLHGHRDIDAIMKPDFPLRRFLEEQIRRLSIDNIPCVTVGEFEQKGESFKRAEEEGRTNALKDLLASLEASTSSPGALAAGMEDAELESALESLLKVYPKLMAESSSVLRRNVLTFFKAGVPKLQAKQQPVDEELFARILPVTLLDPNYRPVLDAFKARMAVLDPAMKAKAERAIRAAWEDNLGTYEVENALSEVTDPFWEYFGDETKRVFIKWFLHFANSDRRPSFPQMRFAKKQLVADGNVALVDETLHELVEAEYRTLTANENFTPERARKWVDRAFEDVGQVVGRDRVSAALDAAEQSVGSTVADDQGAPSN